MFAYRLTGSGTCTDDKKFPDCVLWRESVQAYDDKWAPAQALLKEASVDARLFEHLRATELRAECVPSGARGAAELHFQRTGDGKYRKVGAAGGAAGGVTRRTPQPRTSP